MAYRSRIVKDTIAQLSFSSRAVPGAQTVLCHRVAVLHLSSRLKFRSSLELCGWVGHSEGTNTSDGSRRTEMFAPLILRLHHWVGEPRFQQLRGRAIVLHTRTINTFCQQCHLKPTCRQHLLKTAHNNGKRLGLLV